VICWDKSEMQPQPSLYSAASRADEYEWEGLANSKQQTANSKQEIRTPPFV